MRLTVAMLLFAICLAITPLAALCFALYWPVLIWRACFRSDNQSAPQSKPSTTAGILGDDQTCQKYSKESFSLPYTVLVPKEAGSHA